MSSRTWAYGREHEETLSAALNYASSLNCLRCYEEARALLRNTLPVARRAFGDSNVVTLKMRCSYATALHEDAAATVGDLREAVMTLEETAPIARRGLGSAHPVTMTIENELRDARAALRANEETQP